MFLTHRTTNFNVLTGSLLFSFAQKTRFICFSSNFQLLADMICNTASILNGGGGGAVHHNNDHAESWSVMPRPDAAAAAGGGQWSSYKRDVNGDDVKEAFLRHTSWMDWRHSVPHRRSRTSVIVGTFARSL